MQNRRNPWPWIKAIVAILAAIVVILPSIRELLHPGADTRAVVLSVRVHTGWYPPPWFGLAFWLAVIAAFAAMVLKSVRQLPPLRLAGSAQGTRVRKHQDLGGGRD